MIPEPVKLSSCPKGWTRDLDKAITPAETVSRVSRKLKDLKLDILAENRRMDTGRLNIPVFLSVCGADARAVMPTRKQMGKGSSVEQAEASALMELMERYSFFSFWNNPPHVVRATWAEAEKLFGEDLIPVEQMLASVSDTIAADDARSLLNLISWQFYPATWLGKNKIVWIPIDWFRMLGEFNGSAAGNTAEEAILQALGELVERHVSAIVSEKHPVLPTISLDSCKDPLLAKLIAAFAGNGVILLLKDISLGMAMPTVAALAWDPKTFPDKSEIVFTAGTATSPVKAAIRALTEVAQLAGDFCTGATYEASGLEKFSDIKQAEWLFCGHVVSLSDLPDISSRDMRDELLAVVSSLSPIPVYAVPLSEEKFSMAAFWCVAPGLEFRERDKNKSIGLFAGRKLAEEASGEVAEAGFALLEKIYGDAHFLPFFRGLLALRQEDFSRAASLFTKAVPLQPDSESRAFAAFYCGYAHTQAEKWQEAVPWLALALGASPQMKEAANLLGVCYYKMEEYARAESFFDCALHMDKGSAMDLANRGICRKLQGKSEEARKDLEAAIEIDPTMDFVKKHLLELDRA